MPKLLDYVMPAYNWLQAIDPSLPRAIFVAFVFLSVLAWRKLSPSTWLAFSNLIHVTDEDTSWFKATLLKVWQALPSALLGAVYGALGTGGNVMASLKLAALALLAPAIHEVAWRYQGNLGTKKNPPPSADETVRIIPPGPLVVLVFACLLRALTACSSLPTKPPCDEARLRSIDAEYVEKVTVACLPKYASKEECPAFADLQTEHRRQLKEACP